MRLHFVSLNQLWCEEIKKVFPEAEVTCGDIQSVPVENTAFVSPANCLGFMDGGIDYIYSRKMFPACEQKVKEKIKFIGITTRLGRPYLPIGSALCVSVGETTGLFCAPTMFLPHDVSETRNAYLSFLAALVLFRKMTKYETLVVTSHCCGYGKMSEVNSARQMRDAWDIFMQNTYPTPIYAFEDTIIMPCYDNEQPDNYDNREIKDIPFDRLFSSRR